jgi:uncharacterized repeat protein (TIGR03803 family)
MGPHQSQALCQKLDHFSGRQPAEPGGLRRFWLWCRLRVDPAGIAGQPLDAGTVYTFTGSGGAQPESGLTIGPGGVLYGTTQYGGAGVCATSGYTQDGCGTVFQLTPPSLPGGPWTESVIYSFAGINGDGAAPVAGVVMGRNGSLYGTTLYGGSATSACPASYYVIAGCGIVFRLTPPTTPGDAWTEKVLHSFTNQSGDGSMPVAGLTLSPSGILYGTTSEGGFAGAGTVFAIVP